VGVFMAHDSSLKEDALNLAKELNSKKQFVDMKGYSLRCNNCYVMLKGNAEAVSHNKTTGHTNFVQLT
jgi:ubiquitin thioesterase OTU1